MGSYGINQEFKKTVSEHSEVEGRKGKKRFILWTKAQMAMIAKVFEHVTTSQDRGLRLLVTGGKGAGTTILLIFLARMVKKVIEFQTGESSSKTVVTESPLTAKGLIQILKQALTSSNVTVYAFGGKKNWIFSNHQKGYSASKRL